VSAGPDREPQPEREEEEPDASTPGIRVDAAVSKGSTRSNRITKTTTTALIPSSRDQGTRLFFIEKAATSQ